MKKWLGEASALCGHVKSNQDGSKNENKTYPISEYGNVQLYDTTPCTSNMGNIATVEASPSNEQEDSSVHQCSGVKDSTHCHSSVAYLSQGNTIHVSSPCHHFCTSTVSVQLHPSRNTPGCSNLGKECSCNKIGSSANRLLLESTINHQPTANSNGGQNSCNSDANVHAQSSSNLPVSNGLSLSIEDVGNVVSSVYPQNRETFPHCHSIQSASPPISHDQASQSVTEHQYAENGASMSQVNSASFHSNGTNSSMCEFYGQHGTSSSSIYNSDTLAGGSSRVCHTPQPNIPSSSNSNGSNGCDHWCTTCRVRVQVEVECVSNGQHSPNTSTSKRGNHTLSLPKRVRHKVKGSSKDGGSKKKKSPWSRLNCKLRSNKAEIKENEKASGATCACPTYSQTNSNCDNSQKSIPETSNNGASSSSGNSSNILTPIEQLGFLNPDYPVSDIEENARFERAREMAEGVEPPPGFIPVLRETQNSLTLGPLTYNSVLELQPLLERLGRSLTFPYPSSSVMQHMGRFVGVGALMSRTVHTQVDYIHCLVPDLLNITNCGFYWGKMDRYEAERLLEGRSNGTFLLRDSAHEDHLFSVSFRRFKRSLHARIEQWNHTFSFDSHDPTVFASDSVCGLIEHYKDPALCMFYEPLLTNPLPRTFPFPLQHLCRATICSKVSYDGISSLELPSSLNHYLKEYHYKQRVRVRHFE